MKSPDEYLRAVRRAAFRAQASAEMNGFVIDFWLRHIGTNNDAWYFSSSPHDQIFKLTPISGVSINRISGGSSL